MSEKKCGNCFKIKPISEFYVKRYRDRVGTQSRCKSCNKEVCYVWRNKARPWKIERYLDTGEAVK